LLDRVVEAADQRLFVHSLSLDVAGGDTGQLASTSNTWCAVAPTGTCRARLMGMTGAQLGESDPFRPPGSGVAVLPPGVEPFADGGDRLVLTVYGNPLPCRLTRGRATW
jgi:hypothetical protein